MVKLIRLLYSLVPAAGGSELILVLIAPRHCLCSIRRRWSGAVVIVAILCSAVFSPSTFAHAGKAEVLVAQATTPSPPPPGGPPSPPGPGPAMPPGSGLPPGIGPRFSPGFGAPGTGPATGAPPMRALPGQIGARPLLPGPKPPDTFAPAAAGTSAEPAASPANSANLIGLLDSFTPYVQAFDFVLMVIATAYCVVSLRTRRSSAVTLLAISCFISAVILFGFFLFGLTHGRGVFPQLAYVIARLLAPFELLLFVIGIVLVARANRAPR